MLSKIFFQKLGANIRDKYRKHIFAKARDVYGKSFKGYSMEYRKHKSKGDNFRQDSRFANSTAPVFTGDLLKDFGSLLKATKNSLQIGWASQGAKVKWLSKMGRILKADNQPLPKGIIKFIESEVNKELKKTATKSKVVVHKIGKK